MNSNQQQEPPNPPSITSDHAFCLLTWKQQKQLLFPLLSIKFLNSSIYHMTLESLTKT